MAPRCSICTSAARGEIELALTRRLSVRQVAGRFSVSRSAIDRHVNNGHCIVTTPISPLSGDLEVITDVDMHENPSDLLAELKKASLDSFNMMRRRGDDPIAIAYLKEIRALLAMEIEVAEKKASRPDYVPSPGQQHVLQGLRDHRSAVEKDKVLKDIRARLENRMADIKAGNAATVAPVSGPVLVIENDTPSPVRKRTRRA